MHDYISPFKERTFLGRYKASLKFQLQNIYNLLIVHILFVLPLCYIISRLNDDSILFKLLSAALAVGTITFYYTSFTQYIKNRKAVKVNGDFLKEQIKCALKYLLLYFVYSLFSIIFGVIFALLLFSFEGILSSTMIVLIILAIPLLLLAYFCIPTIHFLLTKGISIMDDITDGIKLQKKHLLGTFGYMIFSITVCFFVEFIFLVFVATFFVAKYGESYEPDSTFIMFTLISMLIAINTFVTVPILYQYGYILGKETKEESNDSETIQNETTPPTEEPAAEFHQEIKTTEAPTTALPDKEDLPCNGNDVNENNEDDRQADTEPAIPETDKGTFRIEGNGTYTIELRAINGNEREIKEKLGTLLGYNEEEVEAIVSNLPSTIAERLTMSEALDLRSLLDKEGASVDIK